MTTLSEIREAPGLETYLDAIEERLARTVASHPGLVAAVGNEALAAGGKRLRPLLVFLSAPAGTEPSIAAGVAVELVHMATLVHDDLIDRAHFRRGQAAAWSVYGPEAARATGRLPLRAGVRGAHRDRRRGRGRDPRRRDALPRTRRGAAADADARSRDDRRGVPRAVRPQDREALRGGLPARRRPGRLRPRARRRVPDRRRRPRLLRHDDRDREDRRHRPPRRHADAAAPARGAPGRRRPRRARRRPARRRPRARCRKRRARAFAGGRARLR